MSSLILVSAVGGATLTSSKSPKTELVLLAVLTGVLLTTVSFAICYVLLWPMACLNERLNSVEPDDGADFTAIKSVALQYANDEMQQEQVDYLVFLQYLQMVKCKVSAGGILVTKEMLLKTMYSLLLAMPAAMSTVRIFRS